MDITAEHEQDDAQAAAGADTEAPPVELELGPDEAEFDNETATRANAAIERLQELSKRLPPGKGYMPEGDPQVTATLNLIVEIMTERGIVNPVEFMLRKRRHVAVILEQALAGAEAHAEAQTGLIGADGEPIEKPVARNRRERRQKKS